MTKLRLKISKAPKKPGVYRWLDSGNKIIYIGKASDLRNRLRSYVAKKPGKKIGPWQLAMRKNISDVDWTVTNNEIEALMLETNLIKKHRPKYNILMKDDKNYAYVKITTQNEFPCVEIVRNADERSARYFGPFSSLSSIKHTLDVLDTVFKYRACKRSTDQMNKNPNTSCRKCMESQIGRCNGLCMGSLTQKQYSERIMEVVRFFSGNHDHVIARLEYMMDKSAKRKQFEQAAKYRDTLAFIKSIAAQQIVSGSSHENTDIFGVALQSDYSQIVLMQERDGKIINELSFGIKGQANTKAEVLAQVLPQYYAENTDAPDIVLCEEEFEGMDALAKWLDLEIKIPKRGKKAKLLNMAKSNASEKAIQKLASWEAAADKVDAALKELKNKLQLQEKPRRMECYDISHFSGSETVGSMAVFIGGKARNDHYRSFTIRTLKRGKIDDCRALEEVLRRRMLHIDNRNMSGIKNVKIVLEKHGKAYAITDAGQEDSYAALGFRYVHKIPVELQNKLKKGKIIMMLNIKENKPDKSLQSVPDIIVVDGGKGQLGIASRIIGEFNPEIPVVAIAKNKERIFVPKNPDPVPFSGNSEAMFMLMRMRDEAHRFANAHRKKRMHNAMFE